MLCRIFVFYIKCQNGLNNCKANASQSPLGCLDVSIGYTDTIHVTHLSVMVLAVLFTFVVVDKEDCIVWSEKNSSFSEDQGFLLKSVFCRWETKKIWLVTLWFLGFTSGYFLLLPFLECPLLDYTAFIFLSLQIVAMVAGAFSCFTISRFLKNLQ